MVELEDKNSAGSEMGTEDAPQIFERPTGPKGLYYNPYTQVIMLGFVCFMCPGLFNALNGVGYAGQLSSETSANANSALYAAFAVVAFFAGSINNVLGARLTLLIGSFGYMLYIGSLLAVNIHPHANAFVIVAGAILGVCAGLLWTAQGSLMLAYPTEAQKGRFIGIFWVIFNLGGVIGSAVSFGTNFHSKANSVSNGTYIGFVVMTGIGILTPLLMANPKSMIRTDGTRVTAILHPSWKSEIMGLWIALRTDPYIVLLFPMFLASNFFYAYQFNGYNAALFNIRTRSLNSMIYWLSQMFGSVAIGILLDSQRFTRRRRAFMTWFILLVMVFVVHGWNYHYQKDYTRDSEDVIRNPGARKVDFRDSDYPQKLWLYIFCGLLDSMWQTAAYWMMGAMSNDPAKLAHFTGFYKSIQSAGAAGTWRADATGVPYMSLFAATWGILAGGLFFMLPMMYWRIHDHQEEIIVTVNGTEQVVPREVDTNL